MKEKKDIHTGYTYRGTRIDMQAHSPILAERTFTSQDMNTDTHAYIRARMTASVDTLHTRTHTHTHTYTHAHIQKIYIYTHMHTQ